MKIIELISETFSVVFRDSLAYFHFFILCPIAVALRKTLHPTVKYRLIEAERCTLRYIIPGLKHHLYHITKLYT